MSVCRRVTRSLLRVNPSILSRIDLLAAGKPEVTLQHRMTLAYSQFSNLKSQFSNQNVSPLCQRVSPLKTLHSLCTSGLCQRVTLCLEKSLYDVLCHYVKERRPLLASPVQGRDWGGRIRDYRSKSLMEKTSFCFRR